MKPDETTTGIFHATPHPQQIQLPPFSQYVMCNMGTLHPSIINNHHKKKKKKKKETDINVLQRCRITHIQVAPSSLLNPWRMWTLNSPFPQLPWGPNCALCLCSTARNLTGIIITARCNILMSEVNHQEEDFNLRLQY